MDIAEFAIPTRWQKLMILHGFDPINSTPSEFIEFCERLEYAEDPEEKQGPLKHKNENKQKDDRTFGARALGRNNKRKRQDGFDPEAFCKLHNKFGHDTGQCREVLDQVNKMRSAWDTHKRYKPNYNELNKFGQRTNENKNKGQGYDPNKRREGHIYDIVKKVIKEAFPQEQEKMRSNNQDSKDKQDPPDGNDSDIDLDLDSFNQLSVSDTTPEE